MLLLRLYKDVILNETYQNVFSLGKDNNEKTVLEKYLDTRTFIDIECPNVYYENSGEFVIDYELIKDVLLVPTSFNIYEFNYIRFIEMDEEQINTRLIRYCFIQDINIKNGCVYIEYKEDIWSSYSDKIKGITESNLIRSRVRNYTNLNNDLLELPYKYDGNNELHYEFELNEKVYILAEIQYYELSSASQPLGRWLNYALLATRDYTPGYNYTRYEDLKFKRYIAERGIARIINGITAGTIEIDGTNYHYEVGDIYVIPEHFNIESLLDLNDSKIPWGVFEDAGIFPGHCLIQFKQNERYKLHNILTETISNDYKILSIGTFSNQIEVINNGTDIEYSILIGFDMCDFTIKLSYRNQLYDITNDFKFEIPYEQLRSDIFAQRKIANQIQNNNLKYGILSESLGIVNNSAKAAGGVLQIIGGAKTGSFSSMGQGTINATEGTTGIVKNIANIVRLNEERTLINAPMYSNGKGIFANYTYFLNYFTGIVICKINPDNEEYVRKFINNFGYKVFKFINDFSLLQINDLNFFTTNEINYNVIRFESSNVYGSFTREIAQILNQILEYGVKIWYDEQMRDDNYVI